MGRGDNNLLPTGGKILINASLGLYIISIQGSKLPPIKKLPIQTYMSMQAGQLTLYIICTRGDAEVPPKSEVLAKSEVYCCDEKYFLDAN